MSYYTTKREQMNYDTDLAWDFVVINEIATEEEARLITVINGYSVESLNDIIEVRTGYQDIEQLWDCERYNYDFDMFDEDDESEEDE